MTSFVHLETHSEYSMLQSTVRIKDMVKTAIKEGMPAVALTDHGNMFGALEFYFAVQKANQNSKKKSKKEGTLDSFTPINPILGCHIYVGDVRSPELKAAMHHRAPVSDRLVLLAENMQGYHNLLRIVSHGHLEGFDTVPLVPFSLLKKHAKGLIALCGGQKCQAGKNLQTGKTEAAKKHLEQYCKIFGKENFFLALQDHGIVEEPELNRQFANMAENLGVPLVATSSIHYLEANDFEAHKILRCIDQKIKYDDYDAADFPTANFRFRSADEMCELFVDYPEAIANTVRIAARCEVKIETGVGDKYWPQFPIPEEFEDGDAYLAELTRRGLEKRFDTITEEIRERCETELAIMKEMKVAGYMLIVQDFINWSRDNGIPVGPGRGSAVGSLVSYATGITDINPLEYGLLFERFLNPERVSMPDIDTDFSDKDREKVIQYVTRTYGQECVSQIVTYGRMKAKAILKDVGRTLGIDHNEINRVTKKIPNLAKGLLQPENPKPGAEYASEIDDVQAYFIQGNSLQKKTWKFALQLENLVRQAGIHAAAVIIAPNDMVELAPLYKAPGEDAVVIQYDKTYAEDIGLLKMDFLGLRNLSVIQDTVRMVEEGRGEKIEIDKIDICDAPTYELLGKGHTIGVFQFESEGMQNNLRNLKPSRLEDMIAMNALYRPGPIGEIPNYIDRKHGKQEIDCYHEKLESVLTETYGVIVYQEQVMQIAQILADFTLGGADLMRRAMAKKKTAEMNKLHPKWIAGAEKNGFDKKLAERIWVDLGPFCAYAFNKSHSAAYAYIGYQTAWLKTHYAPEYMAANMSSELNSTDRLVVLLNEAKVIGVEILHPDINCSMANFTVLDGKINYGLAGIKNVGVSLIDSLVEERNKNGSFTDLFDLACRMQGKLLNKRALESLVMAGAFDKLPGNRAEQHASIDKAVEHGQRKKHDLDMGQVTLFDMGDSGENSLDETAPALEKVNAWSYGELLAKEKGVLGLYLSGHPLQEFAMEVTGFTHTNLAPESMKRFGEGAQLVLGGMVVSTHPYQMRDNKARCSAIIEDLHGRYALNFEPGPLENERDKLSPDTLVLCEGSLRKKWKSDDFELDVTRATLLEDARFSWAKTFHVYLDCGGLAEQRLLEINSRLDKFCDEEAEDGEFSTLVFHLKTSTGNEHILVNRKHKLMVDNDLYEELDELFGSANLRVSREF